MDKGLSSNILVIEIHEQLYIYALYDVYDKNKAFKIEVLIIK